MKNTMIPFLVIYGFLIITAMEKDKKKVTPPPMNFSIIFTDNEVKRYYKIRFDQMREKKIKKESTYDDKNFKEKEELEYSDKAPGND